MNMYPTKLAAGFIATAFPELKGHATDLVTSYAHSVYASRSASLSGFDVLRLKWMIGIYISGTHSIALEAVANTIDDFMASEGTPSA